MLGTVGAGAALVSGGTRTMTEAEWSKQLRDLMKLYGWRHVHFRPALTKQGWRTAGSGELAAGWPDFVIVRERVVFVEIKRAGAKLSAAQEDVRDALLAAGAEWYCWRPEDFDEAHGVLGIGVGAAKKGGAA